MAPGTSSPEQVGDPLETDVCIIGAGPAGITIANGLDGTGIRVCLLESGGEDVERRAQRSTRGTSDGYPLQSPHTTRLCAFGGTLRHQNFIDEGGWAARPLDPVDFHERPDVPYSGWPFDREHLNPYYAMAHVASGMDRYDYDPRTWSDDANPILDLAGTGVESTMFQFGPAKFHERLVQFRRSQNVQLILRSRVVDMVVDPVSGAVREVEVRRDDGTRMVVRSRVVVLAAGGIENPRMLLVANQGRGLGNEHDLVGRYFSERLSTHTGHIVGASGDLVSRMALYSQHKVDGTVVYGALRLTDMVQRRHGLLNCAFFVLPRPASVTTDAVRSLATVRKLLERRPLRSLPGRHVRNIATGLDDLTGYALNRFRPHETRLIVRAQAEQTPNRESRVSVGPRRDEFGLPMARVTWRVAKSDLDSIKRSLALLNRGLDAAAVGRLELTIRDDPPPLMEGNHHHMGTTRMHNDPRGGVVDANSRVHSVPNLFVTGSSVFPTYGSSNPTLTIIALATRLADHVKATLPVQHRVLSADGR